MAFFYPPALQAGDTVGLIAPSYKVNQQDIMLAEQRLCALGYRVKTPRELTQQHGCYAGTVQARVGHLHAMFRDPEVRGIFALKGGAGATQLLEHISYQELQRHPKALVGYSDITALLNAITAQTGLITFHGPMPAYPLTQFSRHHLQAALQQRPLILRNEPDQEEDDVIHLKHRPLTLRPGTAEGRLVGGNLAVFTAMLGSPFLYQDWHDKILCVEEVNEPIYRIDRMLAQLRNAGILSQIAGFIFGGATACTTGRQGGFSLYETLQDVFADMNIPVFMNSMFGHLDNTFTLPIGAYIKLEAHSGCMEVLAEPAAAALT